jgi:hypothetical protein
MEKAIKFIKYYAAKYGDVNVPEVIGLLKDTDVEHSMPGEDFIFIYKDMGSYVYNYYMFFDIDSTTNDLRTFKQFKQFVRQFDEPIYIENVHPKFMRLVKTTHQEGLYEWKK